MQDSNKNTTTNTKKKSAQKTDEILCKCGKTLDKCNCHSDGDFETSHACACGGGCC